MKSADPEKNNHNIQKTNTCESEKKITISEKEYLQLKESAQKNQEYQDRLLRIQAEMENMRKRLEREKQDFIKFANEGIILKLLNILDDLERAIQLAEANHEDFSAFLKGVELILAHLYELLKEHGLKPIEAKGKPFDPSLHEALMQVVSDDYPENTVVEELQKGYFLNDRVIRTSKVKVSKKNENKNDLAVKD